MGNPHARAHGNTGENIVVIRLQDRTITPGCVIQIIFIGIIRAQDLGLGTKNGGSGVIFQFRVFQAFDVLNAKFKQRDQTIGSPGRSEVENADQGAVIAFHFVVEVIELTFLHRRVGTQAATTKLCPHTVRSQITQGWGRICCCTCQRLDQVVADFIDNGTLGPVSQFARQRHGADDSVEAGTEHVLVFHIGHLVFSGVDGFRNTRQP